MDLNVVSTVHVDDLAQWGAKPTADTVLITPGTYDLIVASKIVFNQLWYCYIVWYLEYFISNHTHSLIPQEVNRLVVNIYTPGMVNSHSSM